jgi:hypothetical protein
MSRSSGIEIGRVLGIGLVAALVVAMVAPLAQVQADEIEWKTYKIDKIGFEMDYPEGWYEIEADEDGNITVAFANKEIDFENITLSLSELAGVLAVWITLSKRDVSQPKGFSDYVDDGDTFGIIRTIMLVSDDYQAVIVFVAVDKDKFDEANKDYFNPMVKSVSLQGATVLGYVGGYAEEEEEEEEGFPIWAWILIGVVIVVVVVVVVLLVSKKGKGKTGQKAKEESTEEVKKGTE